MPEKNVRKKPTSGAMIDTYFGFDRMMRAAIRTRKSRPPAASMQAADMQTAMMISITSTGGAVGVTPKITARSTSPRPPQ